MGESITLERVGKLAQAYWESDSSFLQHGPNWDENHWARVLGLPELEHFVWKPEWGEKISRGLILDRWECADEEPEVLEAFFLTMAWGFGRNFRGSWKTIAMYDSMREKNFGTYLLEVRDIAATSSEDAFRSLLTRRVKQLGPVYASKLLYALSPASNRSPVMDMWIERWGHRLFGLDFRLNSSQRVQENVDALKRFRSFCEASLGAVSVSAPSSRYLSEHDAGFIEYLIFWDAKFTFKKKWQSISDFPAWIRNESPEEGFHSVSE